METYQLEKDITVFCIRAKTFPDGILEAHQTLHALTPFSLKRMYFGISRPENGNIVYRAGAAELNAGEYSKHHLETFVLKHGTYVFKDVVDFRKDIPSLDRAFKELLTTPGIDPQGCCVEWYTDDRTCRCMVRLEKK